MFIQVNNSKVQDESVGNCNSKIDTVWLLFAVFLFAKRMVLTFGQKQSNVSWTTYATTATKNPQQRPIQALKFPASKSF